VPLERLYLVGIRHPKETRATMEATLAELHRLVGTAGGEAVASTTQDVKRASPRTLIHRGKVEAIAQAIAEHRIDTVAIDAELTPAQNRNLTDAWKCKVLDRTAIILDIFARRAQTQAGKLQVELAQLQYRLTRLAGRGVSFMQQSGYIGNRGPGETKLEMDRRRIRNRIARLRRELNQVRAHRARHRQQRARLGLPLVSLVGYTNAGKSTILNALTRAGVLVEDKLFATLDPTVRRLRLPSGRQVLLADTVGLIRRLPHHVVEAFRATFEEIARADLLAHIIDAADPQAEIQRTIVDETLTQLDIAGIPTLMVWNKCDLTDLSTGTTLHDDEVRIAAETGAGLGALLHAIETMLDATLSRVTLAIPHRDAAILDQIHLQGHVASTTHTPGGTTVEALVPTRLLKTLRAFLVTAPGRSKR
jgi:GTPase